MKTRAVKPPVAAHGYIGDGVPDGKGNDRCTFCGLAEARADVHTAPAAGYDARRIGERDDIGEVR